MLDVDPLSSQWIDLWSREACKQYERPETIIDVDASTISRRKLSIVRKEAMLKRCINCRYVHADHISNPTEPKVVFGKIQFTNELEGDSKPFDYVSVSPNASGVQILNWLKCNWKMKTPNLILSVIGGGSESSKLDPLQKDRLTEGFTKAVSNTSAWIITSGVNADWLTRTIGNAVGDNQFCEWDPASEVSLQCIGINTFGSLDHHQSLYAQNNKGNRDVFRYKVRQRPELGLTSLNPNHSSFIFVDTGKRGNATNDDYRMRQKLDTSLAPADNNMSPFKAPIVLIVVGGPLRALENIVSAISNNIPVVVCEGTNGCADVISLSIKIAVKTQDNKKCFSEENREQVKSFILERFGAQECTFSDTNLFLMLTKCLDSDFIRVFKVGRVSGFGNELDGVILQSVLRSYTRIKDPLELSLKWNRVDIAYSDVLTGEFDITVHPRINEFMLQAIKDKKISFVKLFMESGFVMKNFLTAQRLLELYNYAATTNEVLGWLLKKIVSKKRLKKSNNSECVYDLKDISRLIRSLTGTNTGGDNSAEGTQIDDVSNDSNHTFDFPFVELTLWAVLANEMDMALFFWARAKEPVMLALIIAKLWKSLARRLWPGEDVFEPIFLSNSEEFQDLAVGVIDTCYRTDRSLAKQLVKHKSLIWNNKTRIEIAFRANCKRFLACACVQAVIESEWKSNMLCTIPSTIWHIVNPFSLTSLEILPTEGDDGNDDDDEDKMDEEYEVVTPAQCGPILDIDPKLMETNFDSTDKLLDDKGNNVQYEEPSLANVVFYLPDSNNGSRSNNLCDFMRKAYLFYTAPITKFVTHSAAYIFLLALYSWMVLHFSNEWAEYIEYAIICLAFTYTVEEIRQLVSEDMPWGLKIKSYLDSEWNLIDVIYLSMIYIAFFLHKLNVNQLSIIFYGMVTMLLWIRLIRLYQAVGRLGPLWIMMRKMFKEMLIFLTVLVVFLLGYGICTVALLFSPEKLSRMPIEEVVEFIFLVPSLQMFGELFLEGITGQDTSFIDNRDPEFQSLLTVWLLAAYLLIGNVLILNLLIAIFGHIYEVVQENSTIEWKKEMFILCQEYANRTVLPPPLSAIETTIMFLLSFCIKKKHESNTSQKLLEKLRIFESYCSSNYLAEKESRKSLSENIKLLAENADEEMEKIHDMLTLVDCLRKDLNPKKAVCAVKAKQMFK